MAQCPIINAKALPTSSAFYAIIDGDLPVEMTATLVVPLTTAPLQTLYFASVDAFSFSRSSPLHVVVCPARRTNQ
jgi:hypothetical protein